MYTIQFYHTETRTQFTICWDLAPHPDDDEHVVFLSARQTLPSSDYTVRCRKTGITVYYKSSTLVTLTYHPGRMIFLARTRDREYYIEEDELDTNVYVI